jgi:hypothetical protein
MEYGFMKMENTKSLTGQWRAAWDSLFDYRYNPISVMSEILFNFDFV